VANRLPRAPHSERLTAHGERLTDLLDLFAHPAPERIFVRLQVPDDANINARSGDWIFPHAEREEFLVLF
jgi:hypothetical protein